MRVCEKCGKEIPDGMKKCPNCKHHVKDVLLGVGTVVGSLLAVTISIASRGKINIKK